jgi:NAD(P)-dependent dehydrogenase (short-subunit alcohol dehydrogenase family)
MAKLLEDKAAIITGAGRGLGREYALAMAKEGAKVVVNDYGGGYDGAGKATGPAQEVVEEIKAFGGEAVPNFADVSSFAETKELVDTAISKFGKLNILVNNAGIVRDKMIFNMGEDEWDRVMAIHLKGTFNCTRHACAYWREQHKAGNVLNGSIINTASDAGLLGNAGQANYGSAKAGIAGMTIIVALEMAKYDVRCNCIAPSARTRLTTEATPSLGAIMGKEVAPGEFDAFAPENMAPLVVYLASDDAKDINGEVVRVMGNRIWLVRGWHTAGTVAKKETAKWEPEELGQALKNLIKKGPPREDITSPYRDVGAL